MNVGGLFSVEPGDRFRQRRALRFRRVRSRFSFKCHDDPSYVSGLDFVNWRSPKTGKKLPGTVCLLLLDDFFRDQLQTLLLSRCQRRKRLRRDGEKWKSHVQPSTLWARVGWIRGIGEDLRRHQLVFASQQRFDRIG